ncbi:hypothetical protein KKG45_14475 [bacterium]|nr:hypothetical protein [bacterium]MBU1676226.1 hypothetical protein [bacterium]
MTGFNHEQEFAARLIRKVAWKMVGKAAITDDDQHDIRQELWLDLLQRLPGYRQDRGHVRAFISRVVKNKAASILRARSAAKRGGGVPDLSLDWVIGDEDGAPIEFHETLSVDDYLRRTRGTVRSEEERRDLALDVRKIVDRLQPHEQVICLLLIDRDVSNISTVVGKPRSTLRDLIKKLRECGAEAGLEDYFK